MAKIVGVFRAVERWCGKEPEFGSDKLRDLWEENGPSGVPFDSAGAELLIDILDQEFTDRPMLLRAVDILELTVSGLVDAVPDGPAEISMDVAAMGGPAARAASAAPASEKTPVRQDFDGAHGYGQATVSIALTDTVSLDSTYKVGRQPPQFQRVSTVQTGLAFRF